MFEIDLTDAKPMRVILTSAEKADGVYNLNSEVRLYVSNASLFFLCFLLCTHAVFFFSFECICGTETGNEMPPLAHFYLTLITHTASAVT